MKEFINKLKEVIGEKAVALILSQLITRDNILKMATFVLDQAEKMAEKTNTQIDDQVVRKIKDVLEIE